MSMLCKFTDLKEFLKNKYNFDRDVLFITDTPQKRTLKKQQKNTKTISMQFLKWKFILRGEFAKESNEFNLFIKFDSRIHFFASLQYQKNFP